MDSKLGRTLDLRGLIPKLTASINYMETFAFLWAILLWGREIQDGTITIETDSSTVQNNFERMRAENPLNMRLIRAIYHVSVHYRLRIIAKWIPGLSNVLPDLLSRGKMDDFFAAAAD